MNNTPYIEHYLLHELPPEEELVMNAHLLIDEGLRENIYWQKQSYLLVRDYGRRQLKAELQAIEHKLFTEKRFESFQKKIFTLFNRKL